jgi:hypothetical protein
VLQLDELIAREEIEDVIKRLARRIRSAPIVAIITRSDARSRPKVDKGSVVRPRDRTVLVRQCAL